VPLTLVAAVGRNGVIGRDGGLPWPPTGDLRHFRELTTGHVLVMGRATYDSIGRPLPDRVTVVLTRDRAWSVPGVLVAHDLDDALRIASRHDDEVFVVGGEQVYAQCLDRADAMVLTEVDQSPEGDAWFPAYDPAAWVETTRTPYEGFDIVTLRRSS